MNQKKPNMDALLSVLRESEAILRKSDNDFSLSSWQDSTQAVGDIERFISRIQANEPFDLLDLMVLFAPTGPIQEVSLSSGWGQQFLELADRFDRAIEAVKK